MKKSMSLGLAFLFWLLFGIGYYGFALLHLGSAFTLKIHLLFLAALVCTTHLVLSLFNEQEKHIALGCFGIFLLLFSKKIMAFVEQEPLVGVLVLIFLISILWYTPQKQVPLWRAFLNFGISTVGLIALLNTHKTKFCLWDAAGNLAIYSVLLVCISEALYFWQKQLAHAFLFCLQKSKQGAFRLFAWLEILVTKSVALVLCCYQRMRKSLSWLKCVVIRWLQGILNLLGLALKVSAKKVGQVLAIIVYTIAAFSRWLRLKAQYYQTKLALWLPMFIKKHLQALFNQYLLMSAILSHYAAICFLAITACLNTAFYWFKLSFKRCGIFLKKAVLWIGCSIQQCLQWCLISALQCKQFLHRQLLWVIRTLIHFSKRPEVRENCFWLVVVVCGMVLCTRNLALTQGTLNSMVFLLWIGVLKRYGSYQPYLWYVIITLFYSMTVRSIYTDSLQVTLQPLWASLLPSSILAMLWNKKKVRHSPVTVPKIMTTVFFLMIIWEQTTTDHPDRFLMLVGVTFGIITLWSGLLNLLLERACGSTVRWLQSKCTDNQSVVEKQYLICAGYLFLLPLLVGENPASIVRFIFVLVLSAITAKMILMLGALKTRKDACNKN